MARSFLAPLRYRFTHPDDVAQFGDDWYVYDEHAITNMPARELIALEEEIGVPLVDVMNGVRIASAMGDLGSSWLAVKLDPVRGEKCPPFAEFDVHTMLLECEKVPASEGKEPSPSPVSMPTHTAVLPTLPPGGSPG